MFLKIVVAFLVIFFVWWGINILIAPKLEGRIEGVVISKNGNGIVIKQSDGTEQAVPIQDFQVGERAIILVYSSKLTGKKQYKYLVASLVGVAGE